MTCNFCQNSELAAKPDYRLVFNGVILKKLFNYGHSIVCTRNSFSLQMSVIHGTNRVVDWLKGVDSGQGSSTASVADGTEQSEWTLVNTIDTGFCHLKQPKDSGLMFSVGESGSISILFVRTRPNQNTLSILCPPKSTSPITLSSGDARFFDIPVFIKQFDTEYVAVHCFTDTSIYLWDTVNHTSRVVYQEGSDGGKSMILCVKDDETVVLGEHVSREGVHNVYLLNTSTDQWSLKGTLRLQTGFVNIADMCYVQMADGTPCLVLCNSLGPTGSVVAIEIVGGKIRWSLGVEQIGEGFFPCSVCIDGDHNIYVCDLEQQKVYMLSAEDGLMISTVLDARQHRIGYPLCIQILEDHLYVSHVNNLKERKWVISKFARKHYEISPLKQLIRL